MSSLQRIDVIVAGSGIAGITAAKAARENGAETLLVGRLAESNTLLSGACFRTRGTPGSTLNESVARTGRRLSDEALVEEFCANAEKRVGETLEGIETIEIPFGVKPAHKQALLEKLEADARQNHRAEGRVARLLVEDETVQGAIIEHGNAVFEVNAPAVIIATGGYASLFAKSNGFPQACGSGIAAALGAGAVVRDLEFVLYHPFGGRPTDSLAGFNVFVDGKRDYETEETLDSHNAHHLLPELCRKFEGRQVLLKKADETIVAGTTVHSTLGGIAIGVNGRTSLQGLYACGEAAGGLHGASRLGGAALSAAVVFAANAGTAAARESAATKTAKQMRKVHDCCGTDYAAEMRQALSYCTRTVLTPECIAKTKRAVAKATRNARRMPCAHCRHKVSHSLLLAQAFAHAADARHESRGTFFRRDFAEESELAQSTFFKTHGGMLQTVLSRPSSTPCKPFKTIAPEL